MPRLQKIGLGRVEALLDGADLRYVTVDGVELIRRIYVTVRDESWDVPPIVRLDATLEEEPAALVLRAVAEQRSATVAVRWEAVASLRGDGSVRYAVVVSPTREIRCNRVGLCLLHPPATSAGRPFVADGAGARTEGTLPRLIAPQRMAPDVLPLFPAFRSLRLDVAELGRCDFAFEGDAFELEDQRNWSDGSFKTYCTPLSRPRPRGARPGETIAQAIELAPPPARSARRRVESETVRLRVGDPLARVVPAIGLGLGDPLAGGAAEAIRGLAPEHLRADLRLPDRFEPVLRQARDDARAAGAPLVLALHLGDDPAAELDELARHLRAARAPVLRVLAFSRLEPVSTGPLVRLARERLAPLLPRARFAGGTDVWFVDLNRGRPDAAAMDGVAWSVTPQVHAGDELTMVEAIDPQTDQALTARTFGPGLELLPGPITLRPRYNPNALDADRQALDHPPSSVDPRQGSAFAAAWTAGSVRAQTLGGVRAVTYFETAGPRGVVAGGDLLPCGEVIALARRWQGRRLLAVDSSAPLLAQALLLPGPQGAGVEGLIANLGAEPRAVELDGCAGSALELRSLRGDPHRSVVRAGRLRSELGPWQVVRVAPARRR